MPQLVVDLSRLMGIQPAEELGIYLGWEFLSQLVFRE